MSIKEIRVCDGCGKELVTDSQTYHLDLKTDRFWNGVETDYNLIRLDFCERCALKIKETLKRLAEQLEG